MHVVATAGHVDHGKSTLVRALTGQDPDRLEEERRRGLSIELGYCWTTLPGVGPVAFVDVPGHERFLTTTLAGLGPTRVAMLVVAADDPWMPQAAEHLAAIDALGIRHGILVVTRSDLGDPTAALSRARAEVETTSLAGCPAVVVSGRTGAGLDDLRDTLARTLSGVHADPEADVRLWVDRVFSVAGAGAVLTGTLPDGTIRSGDRLSYGGRLLRVRGLESLGEAMPEVAGPARVAVRLGGRAPAGLGRGSVLVSPSAFAAVRELDVRLHGDGRLPEGPLLHVGTASIAVRARPLGAGHARIRLEDPLPLRHGDRLVLRDPGSRSLWGADVLDADPPSLRRRGAAGARADLLAGWRPDLAGELDRRGVARTDQLRRLGVVGPPPADAVVVGEWLISAGRAAQWRAELLSALAARPEGMSLVQAARAAGLPVPQLVPYFLEAPVRQRAGRLYVDATLPDDLQSALDVLRARLSDSPFVAPSANDLAALGLDRGALSRLVRDGHLLVLADTVVLMAGADTAARELLRALPQPFTTSQARQALGTSRRVALPLLAHLDRTGATVRLPDDRRRVVDA